MTAPVDDEHVEPARREVRREPVVLARREVAAVGHHRVAAQHDPAPRALGADPGQPEPDVVGGLGVELVKSNI